MPVVWPGEFHGLYSPWGHKESDMTEWLSLTLLLKLIPFCFTCSRNFSTVYLVCIISFLYSVVVEHIFNPTQYSLCSTFQDSLCFPAVSSIHFLTEWIEHFWEREVRLSDASWGCLNPQHTAGDYPYFPRTCSLHWRIRPQEDFNFKNSL